MSVENVAKDLFLQGIGLFEKADYEAAELKFRKALDLAPDRISILGNLAATLIKCCKFDEAETLADRALAIDGRDPISLQNKALVLKDRKDYQQALEYLDALLHINPNSAEGYSNRGAALRGLKKYKEAEASLRQAIQLAPQSVDAYCNLGVLFNSQKKYREAEPVLRQATQINPQSAESYSVLGSCLVHQQKYQEAEAALRRAIELSPRLAEAHANLGRLLNEKQRYQEALSAYWRCLEIDPDHESVPGSILDIQTSICDWECFAARLDEVIQRIEAGSSAIPLRVLLTLTDDERIHRQAAELYANEVVPPLDDLGPIARRAPEGKIRVGYFSADLRNHPVAYLMVGLFEAHDKARFETIAFSFGPNNNDEMRERVSSAFDRFIDVSDMSPMDIARLSRELGIDIAIDVGGYTKYCRTEIFAYRAAPIQANYLGYPGTMGAPYIDYVIADPTVIPSDHFAHYTEKVVHLPHCYQPNDDTRRVSEKKFSRKEQGLPEDAFVYCCFNNTNKITPETFDVWMRILSNVEGSVLWLFQSNNEAVNNLRKEAQSRGIDPERIIFSQRIPDVAEHLARISLADLSLDTLPYNAHTTASDALWVGVPIITCMGESFASRVAASILKAIDLPDLITTSYADYIDLAIELAHDPEKLAGIRQRLQANKSSAPFFDTALFTRHIEQAYETMYQRYQAGLEPEHIVVGC